MTQSLTDRNTHAREAARVKKARDRQKDQSEEGKKYDYTR